MKLEPAERLTASLDWPAGPHGVHVAIFYDGGGATTILREQGDCEVLQATKGVRTARTISIHNADGGLASVALCKEKGEEKTLCIRRTLQPGETLAYENGNGWQVLSPYLRRKVG